MFLVFKFIVLDDFVNSICSWPDSHCVDSTNTPTSMSCSDSDISFLTPICSPGVL